MFFIISDKGKINPDAKETVGILILFDNLFNSANGSFSGIENGKIYRTGVKPTSAYHKLWRESLPILNIAYKVCEVFW